MRSCSVEDLQYNGARSHGEKCVAKWPKIMDVPDSDPTDSTYATHFNFNSQRMRRENPMLDEGPGCIPRIYGMVLRRRCLPFRCKELYELNTTILASIKGYVYQMFKLR